MNIRTRFAPSPTGFLHVGGLRTALFAYLFAKKNGGKFVLRIEDTDRTRLVDGATKNILEALDWAGFSPDEGVVLKNGELSQIGQYGPYIQSERKDNNIYQEYINILIDAGHAYYAFDSSEELDVMRADQQANKLPPRYDRLNMKNSLTLPQDKVKELLESNVKYVIRMKVPVGETSFTDLVRGDITIQNKEVDDQILMKSDGFPTYHFAVVVDDHLMNISHVIRGEEWIPSTPKHVLLYKMFGWEVPTFAHLSLLINEQKQKLSKRHGDVSVQDFKDNGFMPEALVNFVSFLGWNPGTEQEIFSLNELELVFDFDKVAKAAAVFDRQKLTWYNQQYMRKLDQVSLYNHVEKYLINSNLVDISNQENISFAKKAILLEQERSGNFVELVENIAFLFAKKLDYDVDLLAWKKSDLTDAKNKLAEVADQIENISDDKFNKEYIKEKLVAWIKSNEYGVGDVLWPTRIALSGKKNSPGPFEIMEVLGRKKVLDRISTAIELIK